MVAKVLQEPLGCRMLQDVGLDLDSTFKKSKKNGHQSYFKMKNLNVICNDPLKMCILMSSMPGRNMPVDKILKKRWMDDNTPPCFDGRIGYGSEMASRHGFLWKPQKHHGNLWLSQVSSS